MCRLFVEIEQLDSGRNESRINIDDVRLCLYSENYISKDLIKIKEIKTANCKTLLD